MIERVGFYLTRVSFVLFVVMTVVIMIAKGFTLITIEKVMEKLND